MRDITSKQITLRTAEATGILRCEESTLVLIRDQALPKGNPFEIARAAGLLGAKSTPSLIPHCHPVSIDSLEIRFDILDKEQGSESGIRITTLAKSIGRTGIEMEALTAVSVAALTLYDLLKPVDKSLEISSIRLTNKTGGKSSLKKYLGLSPTCAILVCSDSVAAGEQTDRSGHLTRKMLLETGAVISDYQVVGDETTLIQQRITEWVNQDLQFIFTTGGTGLGPRDQTVSAVKEILEKEAVGIAEAIRAYGQQRTPLAMMSRAVAGSVKNTLIITLPGSEDGVRESLEAILPVVFHARKMLLGAGH